MMFSYLFMSLHQRSINRILKRLSDIQRSRNFYSQQTASVNNQECQK